MPEWLEAKQDDHGRGNARTLSTLARGITTHFESRQA
jgi:hypothetical protein